MKKHNKQLSLRLSEHLLNDLLQAAQELKQTKSTFVKKSIVAYLDYYKKVQRPYLTHKNIFTDLK